MAAPRPTMPPSAARDVGPTAYYGSDEDSSDEDDALDDGGCFYWSLADEDATDDATSSAGVQSSSRGPDSSESNTLTRSDHQLADFRTAWLEWNLKQSELEVTLLHDQHPVTITTASVVRSQPWWNLRVSPCAHNFESLDSQSHLSRRG